MSTLKKKPTKNFIETNRKNCKCLPKTKKVPKSDFFSCWETGASKSKIVDTKSSAADNISLNNSEIFYRRSDNKHILKTGSTTEYDIYSVTTPSLSKQKVSYSCLKLEPPALGKKIDLNSKERESQSEHSVATASNKTIATSQVYNRKPAICVPNDALVDAPSKSTSQNLYETLFLQFNKPDVRTSNYGNRLTSIQKNFGEDENVEKQKKQIPLVKKSSSFLKHQHYESSSKKLTDSQHDPSEINKKLHETEWQKPCKHSFVAGAPRPYIGTCPTSIEKLAKFSKGRQKFFLTVDPRKKYCLTNPATFNVTEHSEEKQNEILTDLVKHADNICAEEDSHSSNSMICDEIDVKNPLDLDFEGLDYWHNFAKDEQTFLNKWTFTRVRRVIDRQECKEQMKKQLIKEEKEALIRIPECFDVENRNTIIKTPTPVPSPRYAKLYRSSDKPHNVENIMQVKKLREERYKEAIRGSKEKKEKLQLQQQKEKKEAEENLVATLADQQFEKIKEELKEVSMHDQKLLSVVKHKEKPLKMYPHTMREMRHFKHNFKKQVRMGKEKAIIKRDFYKETLNKDKYYPDAEVQISDESDNISNETPLSEQSSDDEDLLEVGKFDNEIKLRGFHYKMGKTIRGKINKPKGKQKGCITREEWLNELHPKKLQVRPDLESGIKKHTDPNDKNLKLFLPNVGYKVKKPKRSLIRQYIEKRLGRHYDHVFHKNFRMVKPVPKYNVKKFNLVSFLQGHASRRSTDTTDLNSNFNDKNRVLSTLEYIEKKEKDKFNEKEEIKMKRMKLLGLPCIELDETPMQSICAREDGGAEAEWAPQLERMNPSLERMQRIAGGKLPFKKRWNMPAPRLRESTLRRNPRKPRNYELERVPSDIFDQTVQQSNIPFIGKLEPDIKIYENLYQPKRPYTEQFHTRFHHDHWNPTQEKLADVRYQPILAEPKINNVKEKCERMKIEKFQKAKPKCAENIDKDFSMPDVDIDGMIADHLIKSKKRQREDRGVVVEDLCQAQDNNYRTRSNVDLSKLDFPGRQEYLSFLHDVRNTLEEEKKTEQKNVGELQLFVNKEDMIKELEEDLKSIESCLTSFSSSEGSNFSNDSGSVLLLNDQWKLPMDYVRKQYVPFEKLDRSRFKVIPIDVYKENDNPYRVLPFSGQKTAQMQLHNQRDGFNTFSTRLNNGLRLRLEVPVVDVREKLIGPGSNKHYGRVITDVDNRYIEDLKNKPPTKLVNFSTGRSAIKDALRLKFESMVIQGQLVRTKIYDRLNEEYWSHMQTMKTLYEKLFAKWEKTEYEHAMSVVYQVKSYYEETDILRKEYREVERDLLLLNMDIVFIEGHWIRCIMLQNFHYLLGDQDWRVENDWIHRISGKEDDQVELESYDVSIANRKTANIRVREKDDALAIKKFYEEVYETNKHPVLIVFPDAESFLKGVETLKAKTFVLLLELHYTLAIHTELQGHLEAFEEWCEEELKEKQAYMERKCSKKYFMEDRAKDLKKRVHEFLDVPIEESFTNKTFTRQRAIIAEIWRQIVPESSRGSDAVEPQPTTMVSMIAELVLESIALFENLPTDTIRKIEADVRKNHARAVIKSKKAYQIEKRIEKNLKQVRRNLEPPYVKPKRVGKYVKQKLKSRRLPSIVREKSISKQAKNFHRAFHEDDEEIDITEAGNSIMVADRMRTQIVPFYFDHFLLLNGYVPNYNFRTQVDLEYGPELHLLNVRSLIPKCLEKLEVWENRKMLLMEENIARNPKMYENVK